jgi:F-type H+-transporting ATPase subunit gamma
MASRREIINRQRSVASIRRVTRTMEMIATVKSRQTMVRSVQARPYTQDLARLVGTVLATGAALEHPLLSENPPERGIEVLAITSNRGLCGGYNGQVLRLLDAQLQELKASGQPYRLRMAGKRGIAGLRGRSEEMTQRYLDFDDKTSFARVAQLADELMGLYSDGEIAGVRVVYTRFASAGRQYPEAIDLLPASWLVAQTPMPAMEPRAEAGVMTFEPGPDRLLAAMAPMLVRTQLYQCFLDAAVSEQMERRRAMKSATDNANQMMDNLRRQANRARQGEITGELLDIIGGVEALNG